MTTFEIVYAPVKCGFTGEENKVVVADKEFVTYVGWNPVKLHWICKTDILQVNGYYTRVALTNSATGIKMKYEKMNKTQLLAAETFAYSYANYADHLGINLRFDKYMPDDLKIIEKIVNKGGSADDLAAKLDVDKDIAEGFVIPPNNKRS